MIDAQVAHSCDDMEATQQMSQPTGPQDSSWKLDHRKPALRIRGFDFSRLLGVYYYLAIVSGFEQPFSISDSQVSPSTLQAPSLFNELASLLCTQNGSMYCPLRNSEKLFTSFCLGLNSLLEPN